MSDILRLRSGEDGASETCFVHPSQQAPRTKLADRASRAALHHALDMVEAPAWFITATLEIIDASRAAAKALGYSRRRLRTMCLTDLVDTSAAGAVLELVERLLSGDARQASLNVRLRTKKGAANDARLKFKCTEQNGETLIVVTATARAARSRRPVEAELDYLTGLPMRAALEARLALAQRRSRRRRDQYAVLFIDADGFKQVNDTSGHRVGDFVLQTFARRLRACIRPDDFVARYGGDEFVAVIEDVHSAAEVQKIATRIRAELKAEVEVTSGAIHVSVSVGIGLGGNGTTARDALAAADSAMYRAKRKHRQHLIGGRAGRRFNLVQDDFAGQE